MKPINYKALGAKIKEYRKKETARAKWLRNYREWGFSQIS